MLAGVADQELRELRILNAHLLRAGLAERPAVEADQGRMAEIRVDAVEARGVGDRHVAVVGPGHGFRHGDLLLLRRVHVALAADDQLGALHGAIAPDLRVVAVIADDEAHLHALRAFGHVGAVARIPAFDRHPRHDLAVLLHDLALVVHQDQGVVGRLVGMLFVLLAGQREHAPDLGLAAGLGEDLGLVARDGRGRRVHLLRVVHDAVGRIFREDHQVHAGQAGLHADHHVGDLLGVGDHLGLRVQPWHLIADDGDADRVVAGRNITV